MSVLGLSWPPRRLWWAGKHSFSFYEKSDKRLPYLMWKLVLDLSWTGRLNSLYIYTTVNTMTSYFCYVTFRVAREPLDPKETTETLAIRALMWVCLRLFSLQEFLLTLDLILSFPQFFPGSNYWQDVSHVSVLLCLKSQWAYLHIFNLIAFF